MAVQFWARGDLSEYLDGINQIEGKHILKIGKMSI